MIDLLFLLGIKIISHMPNEVWSLGLRYSFLNLQMFSDRENVRAPDYRYQIQIIIFHVIIFTAYVDPLKVREFPYMLLPCENPAEESCDHIMNEKHFTLGITSYIGNHKTKNHLMGLYEIEIPNRSPCFFLIYTS